MTHAHWLTKMRRPRPASRAGREARTRGGFRPSLEALEQRLAPTVNFSISNPAPFPEGNGGTANMLFTVTRSGDLPSAVQVDFATQNGTAVAGVDYQATAGTLLFAANQTTAAITVPVIGNRLFQTNRTFTVALSNAMPSAAFRPQQTFTAGNGPVSVAVGHVNGDGKPDLAVAHQNTPGTLAVLLDARLPPTVPASFAPRQTFATGTDPRSVALGDVNGDGKPDLAVANDGFPGAPGTVSVLLNTTPAGAAAPSFAPRQNFATGQTPSSLALGDVNGDGKPDLAVANETFQTVSVLLNNAVSITVSGSPATGTIADDDAPAAISIAAGNNQWARVGTAFATALAVDVRNAAGALVQGVSVTFTAPAGGATGRFPGGAATAVVVTNANGRATAPTFTANLTVGRYLVPARAAGGTNPSTSFNLSNGKHGPLVAPVPLSDLTPRVVRRVPFGGGSPGGAPGSGGGSITPLGEREGIQPLPQHLPSREAVDLWFSEPTLPAKDVLQSLGGAQADAAVPPPDPRRGAEPTARQVWDSFFEDITNSFR